jgi:hypothetical protein
MRRPAGVRDPGCAVERIGRKLTREIVELALGAAANQRAIVDRTDAGGIIAAIFEPLEAVEQPLRDIAVADNSNYTAHRKNTLL